MNPRSFLALASVLFLAAGRAGDEQAQKRLSVLLLGGAGHHRTAEMSRTIGPALAKAGIDCTYTEDVTQLTADALARYDVIAIYRDSGELPPEQETALLQAIERGKGLVAIHCASHCFRNSPRYGALVGGRFERHGYGPFRAKIIDAQQAAMRGLRGIEVTDETYTHNELAEDIRVLMVRDEAGGYEPSCWVREQGKGRVFYTALGHDERAWDNSGFQKLLANGIRWSAGRLNDELPPLEYVDAGAPIPNYTPGQKWGTQGQNFNKIAKPLPPELSMRHMHLPEGFRVELFAAEPEIKKPMAASWDERGRLWIIESVDYPNKLLDDPHKNGNDRILICEDTDGDGRADKFTVFADHLNIPTAIVHTHGGVVVACTPHLLFLKDTDGDDRTDVREIILTGFGRGDTHAVTSNLRYGLDNWIWGTCGYSGGKVKVGDTEQSFRQCIFRFRLESGLRGSSAGTERTEKTKRTERTRSGNQQSAISNQQSPPRVTAFEVITPTSNNTWGLGFSETGDVFCSTANNQHLVHMAIPNRYFEMVRGWHGVGSAGIEDHKRLHPIVADFRQMDWHGGFTAAAGCEVYTARSFPPEYWNRAVFVCEPTARLVHIDWLVPNGSGFIARDGWNLVASTDPWFGPVDAKVGPDGAVWILDWYNYIIQHNPTPAGFKTGRGAAYETPLRDQTHGRIYRVVYEGPKSGAGVAGAESAKPQVVEDKAGGSKTRPQSPEPSQPRLDGAAPEQLVAALGHESMWVRLTAQRLLVERGDPSAVDFKGKIFNFKKEDIEAAEQGRTEQFENPQSLKVQHMLWTMHGLGRTPTKEAEWGHATLQAAKTMSPAASTALLRVASRDAHLTGEIARHLIQEGEPARVREAAMLTLSEASPSEETGDAIVESLRKRPNASDPWIPVAATAAAARNDREFLKAAADTSPGRTTQRITRVVRTIAEHYARGVPVGSVESLIEDLDVSEAEIAEAIVEGLAAGWPPGHAPKLNESMANALLAVFQKLSSSGKMAMLQLAKRWGVTGKFEAEVGEQRRTFLTQIADTSLNDDARVAAAKQLVSAGVGEESVKALLDLVTPASSPALSGGIIEALGESGSDEVGAAIISRWSSLTPATRRAALAVLVKRPAWSRALLDAIEAGKVDSGDLASDQATTLAGHPDKAIAERAKAVLARKGRLPDPDRQKVLEEFEPITKETGDVAAGKAAFTKHCAKCHTHSGEGAKVGPDLTGMAVHPKIELLTNILDPSRSVEGNFRAYLIATKDGRVLTGLLASETKTALELFDTEGKKQVVLREDIEELVESQKSLMPDGFEKQVSREELINLLEFLAARGKFLPLDLRKVATVVSTRGMFYSEDADAERLIFSDWSPKTVEGVPFVLVDPQGDRVPNAILLYGPQGKLPPKMPKSVTLPLNAPAKAIHLLSGVSGWGFPYSEKGSVSVIVRLHYADGQTEVHELKNGVHFADYIRVVEVPESKLAFRLRGQQLRFLAVHPKRPEPIERIEFVKGPDNTAPIVMAVTAESIE